MQLNDNTSHPSAFISSTFLDLEEERHAVDQTLKNAGVNVNALDTKPASTSAARDEILKGIRESDFVIVIVANRYGSCVPRITLRGMMMSVTEWEYQEAFRHGKSMQVYFKKTSNQPLDQHGRIAPEGATEAAKLKRFRGALERAHSPRYFASTEELPQLVRESLIQVYREGVRHHLRQTKQLQEEIKALRISNVEKDKRIAELEAMITPIAESRAAPRLSGYLTARDATSPGISPPGTPSLNLPFNGLELPLNGSRPVALPPPLSKLSGLIAPPGTPSLNLLLNGLGLPLNGPGPVAPPLPLPKKP